MTQPPPTEMSRAYADALDFLHQRINYERRPASSESFRLRRMESLMDQLGRPDKSLRLVHIAGTKGKGSTARMIAAMLSATGVRTGLYTSPHLSHIGERWCVDLAPATPDQLVDLVDRVRPVVCEMDRDPVTAPTFFELTTAIAFLHFQTQGAKWGVIEVGLGGRLDSTNVITPDVSVITTIGLDHQSILGHTVEAIAGEKAGIIKWEIPVVSGAQPPGARHVINAVASSRKAPLHQLHRDFECLDPLAVAPWGTRFHFRDFHGTIHRDIRLGLAGDHQACNASVALATLDWLDQLGLVSAPWETRRQVLATLQCEGRLQWIPGQPDVVLDVSHNVDSIEALVHTLERHAIGRPLSVVFACSGDKDAAGMLARLAPLADHLTLTRYCSNPRQVSPEKLAELLPAQYPAILNDDPISAFEGARSWASSQNGIVVICGSFFLASELLPSIHHQRK